MKPAISLKTGATPAARAFKTVAAAEPVPALEPGESTQGNQFLNIVLNETAGGTAKAEVYLRDAASELWVKDDNVGVIVIAANAVEEAVVAVLGAAGWFVRVFDHAGGASVKLWCSGWQPQVDAGA